MSDNTAPDIAVTHAKPLRPSDAASLILIDRSGSVPKILMGRRSGRHAFFPDTYVFPGGRRDASDWRVPVAGELARPVADKLMVSAGHRASPARAKALAIAAVRETAEEAGIVIAGKTDAVGPPDWPGFAGLPLAPDLSKLRYVARAITPPGRVRRFDTRFFACFADEVGAEPGHAADSHELQDLLWLPLSDVETLSMPQITRLILAEIAKELEIEPALPFGRPVPFYYEKRGSRIRMLI